MRHMARYVLDGSGLPIQTDDWKVWGEFMASPGRRVGWDVIGEGPREVKVSTVFLGIDHSFHGINLPILWETMIFGGIHDQYQERYSSEDARAGHAKAVALVKAED